MSKRKGNHSGKTPGQQEARGKSKTKRQTKMKTQTTTQTAVAIKGGNTTSRRRRGQTVATGAGPAAGTSPAFDGAEEGTAVEETETGTGTAVAVEAEAEGTEAAAAGVDEPNAQVYLRVLDRGEVDPLDLEIDETKNVRRFRHIPGSIQERAANLLSTGQISPITVTRNEDGKLSVEWGFLRALAGVYIRENNLTPEPWLIRYELVDKTDALTHLVRGAAENLKRKEMGDVDLLHLFQRLKKEGLNQRAIAARLEINEATVSRVLGLEKLDTKEQRLVAAGTIKSEHARELATLPKEARKPLVERFISGDAPTLSEIKAAVTETRRAERTEAAAAEAEGKGKVAPEKGRGSVKGGRPAKEARSLTAKQIAYPFEVVAGREVVKGEEADAVQTWCAEFVKYRNGEGDARKLVRSLYKLSGGEAPAWVKQIPQAV